MKKKSFLVPPQKCVYVQKEDVTNMPKLMELDVKIGGEVTTGLTAAFTSKRRNSDKTLHSQEGAKSNKTSPTNVTSEQSPPTEEKRSLTESSSTVTTPTDEKSSSKGYLSNQNNNNNPIDERRNSKTREPLSSSTPLLVTSEDEVNKRKPVVIDITPMQIEVLPNVKNAENLVVKQQGDDGVAKGRLNSPVSFVSDLVTHDNITVASQTPEALVPDVESSAPPVMAPDSSSLLIEDQFTFADTFDEMVLDGKKDAFLKVFVSEVVNPGLFYVHLVSPQAAKLDEMMDSLNIFYTKNGT